MALSKEKKEAIVERVKGYLDESKITVLAKYDGVSVQALQELRHQAKTSDTSVRVIKNNLFLKAMAASETFRGVDSEVIEGQLLYAFNASDEVAPAQALAAFAKTGQKIEFVGAITNEGEFIAADDVKAMSNLPVLEQLRGQLVGLICSPLSGLVSVLNGNTRGILQVLQARAAAIS